MVIDPHWGNVILLVGNENGMGGSRSFIDQSPRGNNVMTSTGSPDFQAIWAAAPAPPAPMTTTILFPEWATWVIASPPTYWNFANENFCIEGYARIATTDDVVMLSDYDDRVFSIERMGGELHASFSGDGQNWTVIDHATFGQPPSSTWFHFAVYRIGGTFYGALDGSVQVLGTVSSAYMIFPTNKSISLKAGRLGMLCSIRITVGNARYGSTNFTRPTLPLPNEGEEIVAPPPVFFNRVNGEVGQPFVYTVNATGDPTHFEAPAGLPPGLTIDEDTGTISGVPTQGGTFNVQITATNDGGESVCAFHLLIDIAPLPLPIPHITSELAVTAYQGEPFTYQIEATNDPTSFNATEMPLGLSVDTETGLITGTPVSDPGLFPITLSATNDVGTGTATLHLTLLIARPPAQIPVITSPDTASAVVGNPFTYVVTARNVPISFYATGLPNGLAINTQTGTITGQPTEEGTFQVTLSATNEHGTGTLVLTLAVAPTPEEKPCPPPPPRKNLSGPDVPGIHCYIPDGCCGPNICDMDEAAFLCQIRSLLPEGEIFNNTRKSQGEPPKNVGVVTVGCARVGCEQLILGGCCDDSIFCTEDPIAPQLAVVDSFAAVAYRMIQALCQMMPELDPCTADQFVEKWAGRMGISRRNSNYDPCGPEFSYKVLAFLICFVLQLRYNRTRAVNWEFLTMVANRMGADIKLRYAGDMNGTANSDEPYLGGWWSMARDQPVCPPRDPCPPDPKALLGAEYDQRLGGQALDPVACAPPNENSPLSLNIVVCPSDIIVPDNCNLPTAMTVSPLPHDPELYDAFWWLLPQLLPRGPLYCIYECCAADCIV